MRKDTEIPTKTFTYGDHISLLPYNEETLLNIENETFQPYPFIRVEQAVALRSRFYTHNEKPDYEDVYAAFEDAVISGDLSEGYTFTLSDGTQYKVVTAVNEALAFSIVTVFYRNTKEAEKNSFDEMFSYFLTIDDESDKFVITSRQSIITTPSTHITDSLG